MLWERQKQWHNYGTGVLATEYEDALFLKRWFRDMIVRQKDIAGFEIIDLQRYKVIRDPRKVKIAIHKRIDVPFVFVSGNN